MSSFRNTVLVLALLAGVIAAQCADTPSAPEPSNAPAATVQAAQPATPAAPAPSSAPKAAVPAKPASAPPAPAALELVAIEICTGIVERAPQGAAVEFSADAGRLWCFTRIASGPGRIEHVWYREEVEVARVPLQIGGRDWRTWSSKRVPAEWSGAWRVDVVADGGAVLGSKGFRVKAAAPAEAKTTAAPGR